MLVSDLIVKLLERIHENAEEEFLRMTEGLGSRCHGRFAGYQG